MFELNRRTPITPQELQKASGGLVRDIEAFVIGTTRASGTPASLIEGAWELTRHTTDWLRWGLSGMPMTGDQIAAHADAAAHWLRTEGWNPSDAACRGIYAAVRHAEHTDPSHRFSTDTRDTLTRIFSLLIRTLTGAPHAYYDSWDQHPARRPEEAFGLLAAAAVFARTYGPATEAEAGPAAA
ncbi:hypothetical protein [Streptomyces sp. NPDC001787]|uniref:DUF6197 family protein n=1 Tax=Streptomyces sp. NPDC001787 TaxID=3154523 RepID=UPI0033166AD2